MGGCGLINIRLHNSIHPASFSDHRSWEWDNLAYWHYVQVTMAVEEGLGVRLAFGLVFNSSHNYFSNDTLGATPIKERCTPFLFQVGDSKDAVRKGVRTLFRELCSFYPSTKLFGFVLDGLKSKNARQRTGMKFL